MRSLFLALPFALAFASPAAAMSCDNSTSFGGGVHFSAGIHIGEPYTEEEIALLDEIELRREGVETTRVERWNGCVRAWVKGADGREHQQFFDPTTYQRLDLTLR
jgi:hypothetical protein